MNSLQNYIWLHFFKTIDVFYGCSNLMCNIHVDVSDNKKIEEFHMMLKNVFICYFFKPFILLFKKK